jgi:hypothetical protein
MTPQTKNFYKLERRWKDAEVYDLTSVLTSNSPQANKDENGTDGESQISGGAPAEEDPFWS